MSISLKIIKINIKKINNNDNILVVNIKKSRKKIKQKTKNKLN